MVYIFKDSSYSNDISFCLSSKSIIYSLIHLTHFFPFPCASFSFSSPISLTMVSTGSFCSCFFQICLDFCDTMVNFSHFLPELCVVYTLSPTSFLSSSVSFLFFPYIMVFLHQCDLLTKFKILIHWKIYGNCIFAVIVLFSGHFVGFYAFFLLLILLL